MSDPIGIIGLGLLGSAIAERLQEAGYEVHGYDPRPAVESAGRIRDNASEVASDCSIVAFSLPTSEVAASVVGEIEDRLRPGQVVIDTTTGAPDEMIALSGRLSAQGVHYVEANVAGSSNQLRSGEAALFVAGEKDVTAELADFFAALTGTTIYLGAVGNASRFKLVHNLILGLHRAVLAEGLQFAEALGFEAGESLALLRQTPASSGVMSTKGMRIANRNHEDPEARLSQHLKDVRLMLAEAERTGARVPFTVLHRELLEQVEKLGLGDLDNSAIVEAFNRCDDRESRHRLKADPIE